MLVVRAPPLVEIKRRGNVRSYHARLPMGLGPWAVIRRLDGQLKRATIAHMKSINEIFRNRNKLLFSHSSLVPLSTTLHSLDSTYSVKHH